MFDEIGRVHQHHPADYPYLEDAAVAATHRLGEVPRDPALARELTLARVLQRDVDGARAALARAAEADPRNPYVPGYAAFVELYALRPGAARTHLGRARDLAPEMPEVDLLTVVADLMQLRLRDAWRGYLALREAGAL